MARRRASSNRQWNAYSPPDSSDTASGSGSRGQASFFYYNPEGSTQSQWWYNTFAEGQEQPPPVEYNNPYAGAPYYPGYNYTPTGFNPNGFENSYTEYHHTDPSTVIPPPRARSRTPTPPPPQYPSPEYLAVADDASEPISDPSSLRKLLVLDLNGTLLHRSPHVPRAKGKVKKPTEEPSTPSGPPLPRLRPVHPRPYMPSFRSYLFHPHNRAWLDVMIWSSAQPHSVSDMVDKCFGDQKNELVAVWARDTLGLTQDNYNRKVQTTKDLSTPWNQLFAIPSSEGEEQHSLHSAKTTILMDDSPRKAELQPYNHLCIKEYAADIRAKDISSLQTEKLIAAATLPTPAPIQIPDPLIFQPDGTMGIQPDATLLQSTSSSALLVDEIPGLIFSDPMKHHEQQLVLLQEQQALDASPPAKKRKRKSKKTQPEVNSEGLLVKYDETLLAIIGILDEMRIQSNVSAWVKNGGLWGPFLPEATIIAPAAGEESEGSTDGGGGKEEKRQKRETVAVIEPEQGTGNDAAATPTEQPQTEPTAPMWFDNPSTMDHWILRGRNALETLGIPLVHGVER